MWWRARAPPSFDTATVGAGKTVTASGLTLTGAAAGNYVLSSHHRDDHGGDHGADGYTGDYGGEQGLRRHDERDAHELHGDGCRRRRCGGVHGHGGLRFRDRRHGQDGDGERADADRRGRRQLHALVHDGDDDRGDHGADGDAGDDGREQGVRRHDECDARRAARSRVPSAAMWWRARARPRSTPRVVGTGKTVTATGLALAGAGGGELHAGVDDRGDDGRDHRARR